MWAQMNTGAQYHWHDPFKKGIFLHFLNFKVDFLANFESENLTGTTVGKPRKFYTNLRGVDYLFFPAHILHEALTKNFYQYRKKNPDGEKNTPGKKHICFRHIISLKPDFSG